MFKLGQVLVLGIAGGLILSGLYEQGYHRPMSDRVMAVLFIVSFALSTWWVFQ